MVWYVISAPVMIGGMILIAIGLFAGCILISERGNPFEAAAITTPRIIAGSASIIALGVVCELIAIRLVH